MLHVFLYFLVIKKLLCSFYCFQNHLWVTFLKLQDDIGERFAFITFEFNIFSIIENPSKEHFKINDLEIAHNCSTCKKPWSFTVRTARLLSLHLIALFLSLSVQVLICYITRQQTPLNYSMNIDKIPKMRAIQVISLSF